LRHIVKLLFALATLSPHAAICQSTSLDGQPPGSLAGVVRDTTGAPLANVYVTVRLPHDPNRLILQTNTAADGSFLLTALPPTTVLLVAQYPYFSRTTDTVTIVSGRRDSIAVTMRLDAWTLILIGRAPAEKDSSPVVLRFETSAPPQRASCGGVDSVIASPTSITVTGYWSSGVTPVEANGRAYRVGSGIVLDIINKNQELIGNATSCLYWRAVLSSLPTAVYTLNVRGASDPRGAATTWLLLRQNVDLRQPGVLPVENPARWDLP